MAAGKVRTAAMHCPAKEPQRRGCTVTKDEELSLSEKLAHLSVALQQIAFQRCPQDDADTSVLLRQTLLFHSDTIYALRLDVNRKEEAAYDKISLLEATVDELRVSIRATQEERKRVAQELKHTQSERLIANERARSAEEKLKLALDQDERHRKDALDEKQRTQQLQKRMDGLLQRVKSAEQQCQRPNDGKSKKLKDSVPDIVGLQRGLDKAKAQLKKKQDEFQAQAQALHQATVRLKGLEQTLLEGQKKVERLEERIDLLTSQMEEEQIQMRSDRLGKEKEIERRDDLLNLAKERYQAATLEIARLNRLLDHEVEKAVEREAQSSEQESHLRGLLRLAEERTINLVEQVSRQEEQLKATSYEPLGDANIADRIRIRNLVDQVQERLATKAGLKPSGPGELLSLTWRVALGPGVDDASRVQRAKELLADKQLDQHDRDFLADEEALRHVCQHYSRFRKPGNELHQLLTREGYLVSIRRYLKVNPSEDKGDALFAMANYVRPSN